MELPTLLVSVFEVSFILRYGREEMQAGRTFARLRLWLSIIVMPQEAAEKRETACRADESPRAASKVKALSARLKRLRRKSEKQIPRGLKPARNDKNKRLICWPKGQHYHNTDFFGSL